MSANPMLIRFYEEILQGHRHAFPPHYFVGVEGKRVVGILTRYVIEDKERWTREDICLEINRAFFEKYRLAGMVKTYFHNSVFAVLDNAYPGEFHPWELVRARRHLYQEELRQAVRWMVLEKLRYIQKDYPKNYLSDVSGLSFGDFTSRLV